MNTTIALFSLGKQNGEMIFYLLMLHKYSQNLKMQINKWQKKNDSFKRREFDWNIDNELHGNTMVKKKKLIEKNTVLRNDWINNIAKNDN